MSFKFLVVVLGFTLVNESPLFSLSSHIDDEVAHAADGKDGIWKDGEHGQHGAPGQHGGHGGSSLFGNGGHGGNGGDGAI